MRNLLTLLFLFFIINTSFADNYTYLKGPQISFSNQLVTSSGGTTTFNSLTPMITTVTGTQTQIIKLPSVSSIPVGYSYQIINESTQALTVKDSLDVVIASIEPDTDKKFILFTGGSWSVSSGGGGQGGSEYVYAGAVTVPSITDNGGGSVTVGALDVVLFNNATQVGTAKKYSLPALTVTLIDNATNYIIADYASGSPALTNTTNINLINESSVVPIYTIYRSGSFLHIQSWDSLGNGLANKLHQSIVKTQRYRRESGLALGESGTRNVTLGSGIVWTGANSLSLGAISTGTDNLFYFLRTGASTWTTQVVTQYNNTDYWNGTTTASLTNNRYAVNWVYRGVESQKHLYVVLGEGDYTLTQAQASQPPANLPPQITSHALLVGRIIVLKSASTATQIDSSFNVVFSGSGASDHNSLTGLQGGTTGEYYHLTAAEDTAVASLSGTTTNYVLKRSATGFSNSAIYDDGGNIGIGTTSATGKLDVVGTMVTRGAIKLQSGSASGSFLFGADVNATTITTNTRKLARASMPSYDTSIANIALFAGDSTATDNIVSMGGVAGSTSVVGATQLSFYTATTTVTTGVVERMRVDKVGNVGIGTISPGARLQVEKNDEPFTSGEHFLSLIRRDSNGGGMIIGYQSDGTIINANTIRGSGSFDVWFGTASNRSAIVVSNTTGNVGIGNSAPAVKLDVTGDVAVSGYQYFGSPTTNGSFRMYVSGGALKIEKRISGTWTSVGQFDEL